VAFGIGTGLLVTAFILTAALLRQPEATAETPSPAASTVV
jgi:hypothetical protein